MKLLVAIIVGSITVGSPTENLACRAQTEAKLPDGAFKCVEFLPNSNGNEKEDFCARITSARHGYLFPDSVDMTSSGCMEANKRWLCYCNPSDNCNSMEWIQSLVPELSKCPEKWNSSLKYHTTGTSYWMKFMNSDPNEAKDVRHVHVDVIFKPLAINPTPTLVFTPKRQEEIYNISSLVLVLVCLFSTAYITVTVVWNLLATKEMFSG